MSGNIDDLRRAWAGGSGNIDDLLRAKFGGSGNIDDLRRAYFGGSAGQNIDDVLRAAYGTSPTANIDDRAQAYYGRPAYLHRSTFTAPDGTALESYTPEVGSGWTAQLGAITIMSGYAQPLAQSRYTTPVGASDVLVGATIRHTTDDAAVHGITLRFQDSNNLWELTHVSGGATNLYEIAAGVSTVRGTANPGAFAAGVDHRYVVSCSGSTITVYRDGVQLFSYAAATNFQTATRFGLRGDQAQVRVDDIEVYAAGAVAVPGGVV